MRLFLLPLTLFGVLLVVPAPAGSRPPRGAKAERDARLDKAVDRAVEFLHRSQDSSEGCWGGNVAVTSLAVMAFLSAGHTPGEGKYGKTIESGVRWVLRNQHPGGLLANAGGHEMYHHGIATLMLAEVAGMTDAKLGKDVRRALEKAVALILKAQRTQAQHAGGWRYRVTHYDGSDMSVTGWQLMALRAAKNLGCDVPARAIDRAVDYVKRCQDPREGGFCYMPRSRLTIACTGTGILALEVCGKEQHHSPAVLRAGGYLIRRGNLPRWGAPHFYYSIYYGSQASFQLGGNYWSTYRPQLHKALLGNQRDNGAWVGGGSDSFYGSAYCTAMAVLALTVEYRYLPIYQREEPAEKDR
jgi:hypothetical protein